MPRRGDRRGTRRGRAIGAAVGLVALIGAAVGLVNIPGEDSVIPTPSEIYLRLDLGSTIAAPGGFYRDLGALPSTDTWCTTARTAEHCWVFQQSSGDATDYGTPGGWHMTPNGSPRAGVVISVPVRDSTGWTSVTGEKGIAGMSSGNYFKNTPNTQADATKMSLTLVWQYIPQSGSNLLLNPSGATYYVRLTHPNNTRFDLATNGTGGSNIMRTTFNADNAWHCCTSVMDKSAADLGVVYCDGAEMTSTFKDFSSVGSTAWSGSTLLVGYNSSSTIARLRMDLEALTLAQHQALCGDLWQAPAGGVNDRKPQAVHDTWTQTGGARCYPSDYPPTRAVCVPGGLPPYVHDASGLGVPVDGKDQTNRVLYSTGIDCTTWTCATSTIAAAVAPDGSNTAGDITHGGGTVDATATGYANSTALTMRFWANCSSGTFDATHVGGAGHWTVACATVGGAWTLLTSTHAAVTEVQAWQSDGSGNVRLRFSGADAKVWAPTLTEEAGTGYSVIPTGASAVSTGDISWSIANGLIDSGAQLLADGDCEAVEGGDATTIAWTAGNNATLTKDATDPHGGVRSLRIAYSDTSFPLASQAIITIGKMYRVIGWGHGDGTFAWSLKDAAVTVFTGTNSTSWQGFDFTYLATATSLRFLSHATAAGYAEIDDVTVYEQEPYGDYYRVGDTVTQDIWQASGTCWDTTSSTTGALLLSGASGSECSGVWYGLEVRR